MKSLQLFVVAMIWTTCAMAQFTESQTLFSQTPLIRESQFGAGISVFDVDEDGWDDVTVCSFNLPTRYFHNNQGQLVPTASFPNSKNAKSCVWADLDNDGLNDLVVTRLNAPVQIFWQNAGFNFTLDTLSLQNAFLPNTSAMGMAIGDFNRDALLDVMVANYSYAVGHHLFVNQGDRSFTLGPYGNINYTNTMAFQPTFIDLTNDNYPELYLVNDHEAPCELYQYDPALDQFNNLATQYGLTIPSDAMSNSWSDFDNDGDFDVYVSNGTNLENHLQVNQGDTFTSAGIAQNLVFNLEGWGGLWIDMDNDGWQDLIICTREGYYHGIANNKAYHNDHSTLQEISVPMIYDYNLGYFTAAKGDFNNDGTSDMIMSAETNAQLGPTVNLGQNLGFLGIPTENHFLKFRLAGRWSNRNGIGARFHLYTNDMIQSGFSMAGEIYLSQNSQNFLYGLSNATVVDSLVVYWPSGLVDAYYNLPADSTYLFTEGETHNFISVQSPNCFASEYQVSVNTFPNVAWSNTSLLASSVNTSNSIEAFCSTGFGNTVAIPVDLPPVIPPTVVTEVIPSPCMEVALGQVTSLIQSFNGDTLSFVHEDSLSVGSFDVHHTFSNACTFDTIVCIVADYALEVVGMSTTGTCPDGNTGTASVEVSNGFPATYNAVDSTLTFEQLNAGTFAFTYTDPLGCSIDSSFVVESFPVPEVTIQLNELTSPLVQAVAVANLDSCSFVWQDSSVNDTLIYISTWAGDFLQVQATSPDGCTASTTLLYIAIPEIQPSHWGVEGNELVNRSASTLHNLQVFAINGQLIYEHAYFAPNARLILPSGVYLIRWNNTESRKIVVGH